VLDGPPCARDALLDLRHGAVERIFRAAVKELLDGFGVVVQIPLAELVYAIDGDNAREAVVEGCGAESEEAAERVAENGYLAAVYLDGKLRGAEVEDGGDDVLPFDDEAFILVAADGVLARSFVSEGIVAAFEGREAEDVEEFFLGAVEACAEEEGWTGFVVWAGAVEDDWDGEAVVCGDGKTLAGDPEERYREVEACGLFFPQGHYAGIGGVSVEEEVCEVVVRRGAEHCVADADGEFILGNIFDLKDDAVCEGFEFIVPTGEIAGFDLLATVSTSAMSAPT
jgi:hypothetical protein